MAFFNETLQGRFNEVIRRLHGMKGTPAPQVAPEISHILVLENDRPEYFTLHGGFLWAARGSLAAAVGITGIVGIRNPTGSGLLVVITSITVDNRGLVAAAFSLYTRPQGAIQAAGTTFFRDSRRGFGGNCPVQLLTDNTNAAPIGNGSIERVQVTAGEGDRPFNSVPWVLTPGFDVLIETAAVNLDIDVDFAGYARHITPEELTP